jgi:hypothetical protein
MFPLPYTFVNFLFASLKLLTKIDVINVKKYKKLQLEHFPHIPLVLLTPAVHLEFANKKN